MFEFRIQNPALAILKEDHDTVKDLFDRFVTANGRSAKKQIADRALRELKMHAAIEEDLFYSAVRESVDLDIMNEADEEHHIAKILIAELESMDGSESHYDAKFTGLAENVRHHFKEEEDGMFSKAKNAAIDFDALSAIMRRRRVELLADGVPTRRKR
jgi:hypothetical protein